MGSVFNKSQLTLVLLHLLLLKSLVRTLVWIEFTHRLGPVLEGTKQGSILLSYWVNVLLFSGLVVIVKMLV